MAVGLTVTAQTVNDKSGQLVTNLWRALDDCRQWKLWLDDSIHNDAFLTALGFSGSSAAGDIKLLRDSFADLGGASGLWAVSHATFTPSGANNYFFNAKQLTGANYTG